MSEERLNPAVRNGFVAVMVFLVGFIVFGWAQEYDRKQRAEKEAAAQAAETERVRKIEAATAEEARYANMDPMERVKRQFQPMTVVGLAPGETSRWVYRQKYQAAFFANADAHYLITFKFYDGGPDQTIELGRNRKTGQNVDPNPNRVIKAMRFRNLEQRQISIAVWNDW